jgi:hypothetical protein
MKRWHELFALARDENFQDEQAQAFPQAPHLPLLTMQAALQGAAESDEAGMMAEFMLRHAWYLREITHSIGFSGRPMSLRCGELLKP